VSGKPQKTWTPESVVIMIDTAMTFENAMPARVSARICG
jgi:hypothetical protein